MFPASRIEWLTGLTKYDITSIISNIGLNARGALDIQNKLKYFNPFLKKPNTVTNRNTDRARIPVTAIWLVVVKLYGKSPNILPKSMKVNNVKM